MEQITEEQWVWLAQHQYLSTIGLNRTLGLLLKEIQDLKPRIEGALKEDAVPKLPDQVKEKDLACEKHKGNWHLDCKECYGNYVGDMNKKRSEKEKTGEKK